jgi:type II secretory pathway component PulF
MAIEIEPASSKANAKPAAKQSFAFGSGAKIKASERMFFIEQLALMLETGIDLHRSLQTLAQQSENQRLAEIIGVMVDDIAEGKPFSVALAKHPAVFSPTYVSLVAASESGGYLQRILQHLLEMEKQQEELRASIVSAASYPVFLLLFSLAVVVFILAVVFPKFADLFSSIENQLPVTTVALMALSHVLLNYWWALLAAAAVLGFAWLTWSGSAMGQYALDRFKLTAPILKKISIKLYLIQTLRVLGLSLKHGVNLLEALKITKDVVKNQIYHEFIDGIIQDINEGRKMAHGFQSTAFIPPVVKQMIATGEETGNLALVCTRLADYFQKDLEKVLKLTTKAMEPIMLIFMGVVVGVIVSSLILPIFKLSHAVH